MFGEKMREIRESKGYTQSTLGMALNLSPSTVGMYEQGRRLPDTETLIRMCDLFNVSSDYLLEISDTPKPYEKSHSEESLEQRIKNLIRENEFDKSTVAQMAKIRKSRLDDILSGKSPNINELQLLAECFGESTDYLLCLTDEHYLCERKRGDLPSLQNQLSILMDNYTELEVSDGLDISTAKLRKILIGNDIPDSELLQKMAAFFHVSTDFLLGIRQQTRKNFLSGQYPFSVNDVSIGRIQNVLKSDNDEYLAESLGLTDDELFLLYHYGFVPHISVIAELCKKAKVSADYLLAFSDSTISIRKGNQIDEDSLLTNYRKLKNHYRQKVDGVLSEQILQQERDEYLRSSVAADGERKASGK